MAVDITAILTANIAEFKAKMAEAGVTVDKLKAESSSNFQNLSSIGKGALLGIAAGAVAVGAVSVDMGAKFQSAMEMIHTQAGASQQEVNKMTSAVLALAGPTATSPMELATALYHLESAGLRGQKALEALKFAAEGAKVGHADLESVTNALNAAIASGIPGVQNMSQAMGALNAIVGAGDMKMQDLADAMSTGLLAAVKGYGLSLNDVGGALATFGDNNIRGQNAATELRMAVMAMAVPAKTAGKVLTDLGMTTKTLADDMAKGGLNLALTDLHQHLAKAGDLGTNLGEILTTAFGKKAGVGINVLEDQFTRFQSKIAEVNKGAGSFGEDWKATTHTLSFQMDQARATAEALATRLGMFLIPKLEELLRITTEVVNWLERHKEVAIALGVAIGGVLVTAVTAYAVSMASAAIATIAATYPILLIIAAVALVALGIYELATHWHQVWTDIKNWVADAASWIRDHFYLIMAIPIVGWILVLAANWKSVFNDIKVAVTDAWAVIQPIFNLIKSAGIDYIEVNIAILRGIWQAAWTVISGAVSTAWAVISTIIAAISFGIGAVESVINGLKTAWDTVWGDMKAVISDVGGFIQGIIGTIQSTINGLSSTLNTLTFGLIGASNAAGHAATISTGAASSAGAAAAGGNLTGHAAGGPVSAMTPYIVGEQGPELFVPRGAGNIVPNNMLGGGGQPTMVQAVINIDGQAFMTAIVPAAALYQRTVPLPVFGTSNIT